MSWRYREGSEKVDWQQDAYKEQHSTSSSWEKYLWPTQDLFCSTHWDNERPVQSTFLNTGTIFSMFSIDARVRSWMWVWQTTRMEMGQWTLNLINEGGDDYMYKGLHTSDRKEQQWTVSWRDGKTMQKEPDPNNWESNHTASQFSKHSKPHRRMMKNHLMNRMNCLRIPKRWLYVEEQNLPSPSPDSQHLNCSHKEIEAHTSRSHVRQSH